MTNRIKRTTNYLYAVAQIKTSAAQPGDYLEIVKNQENRWIMQNLRTGKVFLIFASMLRNSEIVKIERQAELTKAEIEDILNTFYRNEVI